MLTISMALATYMIMRGDAMFGVVYANYMCSQDEANIKVYSTVELRSENWDSYGWPKYFDKENKEFLADKFNGRYLFIDNDDTVLYRRVILRRLSVQDTVLGITLASVSTFRPIEGWYARITKSNFVSGEYCGTPGLHLYRKYTGGGPGNADNLYNMIFEKYNF